MIYFQEKNYLEKIQVHEQKEWDLEYAHLKTGEQRWFHNIAMCSEVNGNAQGLHGSAGAD